MTTLVFIHGTGVRKESFEQTFATIQDVVREQNMHLTVKPCFWGGTCGANLHKNGASIPNYDTTRGVDDVTDDEYLLALWSMLYRDPLYELRTLSLQMPAAADFVPGQVAPGAALEVRLQQFAPSPALQAKLQAAGLDAVFDAARDEVARAPALHDALQAAPDDLGPYYDALARALVAEAIVLHMRRSDAVLVPNADLRDEIARLIADELGKDESSRGIAGWAARQLLGLAFQLGAFGLVERKRGAITDATYPAAADIVLYQGRGDEIRAYIRECIKEAAQADPQVLVLAHSLGGIAAVDVLAAEEFPAVKLLVTAGTQAPLFYEIDALHSLPYGKPLPAHFPRWLNIYDPHDYLSYIGAKLFAGRMEDVRIDSRQPFPYAHSAYWTNPQTWESILKTWRAASER